MLCRRRIGYLQAFFGILRYSRLLLKADMTLLPKNAFFFISYSLKRLALLHGVTSLLENSSSLKTQVAPN